MTETAASMQPISIDMPSNQVSSERHEHDAAVLQVSEVQDTVPELLGGGEQINNAEVKRAQHGEKLSEDDENSKRASDVPFPPIPAHFIEPISPAAPTHEAASSTTPATATATFVLGEKITTPKDITGQTTPVLQAELPVVTEVDPSLVTNVVRVDVSSSSSSPTSSGNALVLNEQQPPVEQQSVEPAALQSPTLTEVLRQRRTKKAKPVTQQQSPAVSANDFSVDPEGVASSRPSTSRKRQLSEHSREVRGEVVDSDQHSSKEIKDLAAMLDISESQLPNTVPQFFQIWKTMHEAAVDMYRTFMGIAVVADAESSTNDAQIGQHDNTTSLPANIAYSSSTQATQQTPSEFALNDDDVELNRAWRLHHNQNELNENEPVDCQRPDSGLSNVNASGGQSSVASNSDLQPPSAESNDAIDENEQRSAIKADQPTMPVQPKRGQKYGTRYKCSFCTSQNAAMQDFNKTERLYNHIKEVHMPACYICMACGMGFGTLTQIRLHLTHSFVFANGGPNEDSDNYVRWQCMVPKKTPRFIACAYCGEVEYWDGRSEAFEKHVEPLHHRNLTRGITMLFRIALEFLRLETADYWVALCPLIMVNYYKIFRRHNNQITMMLDDGTMKQSQSTSLGICPHVRCGGRPIIANNISPNNAGGIHHLIGIRHPGCCSANHHTLCAIRHSTNGFNCAISYKNIHEHVEVLFGSIHQEKKVTVSKRNKRKRNVVMEYRYGAPYISTYDNNPTKTVPYGLQHAFNIKIQPRSESSFDAAGLAEARQCLFYLRTHERYKWVIVMFDLLDQQMLRHMFSTGYEGVSLAKSACKGGKELWFRSEINRRMQASEIDESLTA